MYYLNFKKLRYCKSEIAPKDYDFTVADEETFEITETTGFKIGLYFGKDFNNFFDNVTVEKNKKVLLNTNDRKVLNEFIASFCDC